MNTKNTTSMDDCLNVKEYIPECNTTPRFMQAMDFLKVVDDGMVKICICGKVFNTNFGDYDTCYQCEKSIEAKIEHEEFLEVEN